MLDRKIMESLRWSYQLILEDSLDNESACKRMHYLQASGKIQLLVDMQLISHNHGDILYKIFDKVYYSDNSNLSI